eukprot:18595-Eustigmatos_ZCMA.PRE.1
MCNVPTTDTQQATDLIELLLELLEHGDSGIVHPVTPWVVERGIGEHQAHILCKGLRVLVMQTLQPTLDGPEVHGALDDGVVVVEL